MQLNLKTLLRRAQDLAGFIVKSVRHTPGEGGGRIDVDLGPDPRRRRRCSCCGVPERALGDGGFEGYQAIFFAQNEPDADLLSAFFAFLADDQTLRSDEEHVDIC